MIPYLLYSGLVISLCYLFYKIFLSKNTFFTINRWYFLVCLALSFALPFIHIPQQWSWRKLNDQTFFLPYASNQDSKMSAKESTKMNEKPFQINPEDKPSTIPSINSILKVVYYLYFFGMAVLLLYLIAQIISLLFRAYTRPSIVDGMFRIVEVSGDKPPCSFGHFIFINPNKYDWDTYNQILSHEKIHIMQRHTIDLIVIEVVLALQWFNPFVWFFRKAVEDNLEFLTDQTMLLRGNTEASNYQINLLKVTSPNLPLAITTNYNQSLLKKRIVMMNLKRTSIHKTWKYFFIVPVFLCVICMFNKPGAMAQGPNKQLDHLSETNVGNQPVALFSNESEGAWLAMIRNNKVDLDLKSSSEDINWSSNSSFMLDELNGFRRDHDGVFTIVREAGTLHLKGSFKGNEGYGHYHFEANSDYFKYVKDQGLQDLNENDFISFFLFNVKKETISLMYRLGYNPITKNDLLLLNSQRIDESFLTFWKRMGYSSLAVHEIMMLKNLGIDTLFAKSIIDIGYPGISINELIRFKTQNINPDYIQEMNRLMATEGSHKLSPDQICQLKSGNVDPIYLKSLQDLGYSSLSVDQIFALRVNGVTSDYIKLFAAAGYRNIPFNYLSSFKHSGIVPQFIKGFNDLGYNNIPFDVVFVLYKEGINSDYVAEMRRKGIVFNDLMRYVSLKNSINTK